MLVVVKRALCFVSSSVLQRTRAAGGGGGRGGVCWRQVFEEEIRYLTLAGGVVGHGSGGAAAGVRGVDRNFVVGEKEHAIIVVEKVP